MSAAAVLAAVAATSVPVMGQGQGNSGVNPNNGAPYFKVQKTPWGDPDLQGIWTTEQVATPMERPTRFGDRQFMNADEIAAAEKAAMDRYTKAMAAANPSGPRSTADIERTKNTVEAGIYGAEYNNSWMEQPRKPGALRWRRTSLVVDPPDGRIPAYTLPFIKRLEAREEARKNRGEADTWEDRNLNERCMTPQAATGLTGTFRIIQAPNWVVILPDGLQPARLVPLDGRPQVSTKIRGWFGRSRAHWDGDKLVVETTNYNDKLDGGPVLPSRRPLGFFLGSGETLKRTETYRRVQNDQLEYAMTTEDPSIWVKPYTVLRPMVLNNNFLMLQSGCHEGNYGMPNILSAARADEKYAMDAALEAAAERKPQIERMKKDAEEYAKTGKRLAPASAGAEQNADR
jgi:hypothetical protein